MRLQTGWFRKLSRGRVSAQTMLWWSQLALCCSPEDQISNVGSNHYVGFFYDWLLDSPLITSPPECGMAQHDPLGNAGYPDECSVWVGGQGKGQ